MSRSVSLADPLHLGIDAAVCQARAELARCPAIAAQWHQAALTIARLGGEALWAPPRHLIGEHGPLFDSWTQAQAKTLAWRAQAAGPQPWNPATDALFPLPEAEVAHLTDEGLLALAKDHLADAEDHVDGTEANAQVRIDMGQDIVEQVVMALVARGWSPQDPRLAPYVAFAPRALPRAIEEAPREQPEHLARLARAAHRRAELFQLGETWRVFPAQLDPAACPGVLLTVSLSLTQAFTAEALRAFPVLAHLQAVSPHEHFAIHHLTQPGQADITQCSVSVPLAPSEAQRDAVVALFQEPVVNWVSAVVELRYGFEGEPISVQAPSQLTWNTYAAERQLAALFALPDGEA